MVGRIRPLADRLTVIGYQVEAKFRVLSCRLSVIRFKRFSEKSLLDDGQLANEREVIRRQARERRVEGNRANEFAQFFATLERPEKIYWRRKSANAETREAGCAITC